MELVWEDKTYQLHLCRTAEQVQLATKALSESTGRLKGSSLRILGVDIEMATGRVPTLLQLCTEDVVVVVDLLRCDPDMDLLKILSKITWIKVGNAIEQDFTFLMKKYTDMRVKSVFDLFLLGNLAGMKYPSLYNMYKSLSGTSLSRDKTSVLSDYENYTEDDFKDAAMDAIASYEIGMLFFSQDFSECLLKISSVDEPPKGVIRFSSSNGETQFRSREVSQKGDVKSPLTKAEAARRLRRSRRK